MKYNCKCCNYSTDLTANYERHLKSQNHVNNSKSIKHKCFKCDKEFAFKSGLIKHTKICDNILLNNEDNEDIIIEDPKIEVLLLKQKVKFLEEKAQLESKLIKEKAELEYK